jgi:hypothetical protein
MVSGAVRKAACTASPTTWKRTPLCASRAIRMSVRWRSTAFAIAAQSRSQSAVLPALSVKRKVTVPDGRSGIEAVLVDPEEDATV